MIAPYGYLENVKDFMGGKQMKTSIQNLLKRLKPCRLFTHKLRVKIVDLKEEKSKLSNKVREKQAIVDELRRRIRRLERR